MAGVAGAANEAGGQGPMPAAARRTARSRSKRVIAPTMRPLSTTGKRRN